MSKQIRENKSPEASYVSVYMQTTKDGRNQRCLTTSKVTFSPFLCQNTKFYSGATGRGWLLEVFSLEKYTFLLFKRHDHFVSTPDLEGCYSSLLMFLSM